MDINHLVNMFDGNLLTQASLKTFTYDS